MEQNVLIGMVTLIALAIFIVILPKACATEDANRQAVIALHKDRINGIYISAADQALLDITEDNRHANKVLRDIREGK